MSTEGKRFNCPRCKAKAEESTYKPRMMMLELLDYLKAHEEYKKIFNRSRERPYVSYRQFLIKVLKDNFDVSFSELGRFFGIDHSTVIYAYKKLQKGGRWRMFYKKEFEFLDELKSKYDIDLRF